jgi:hypothetical protein
MPDKKNLVIFECGTELSPFTKHFLNIGKFFGSIVANSIGDFIIDPIDEDDHELWIPLELINLINCLVPGDDSASPLLLLYEKSHFKSFLPLSPHDQFVAEWLTRKRKNNAKDYLKILEELFDEIIRYSNKQVKIFPLKNDSENRITFTYRDQTGFIRPYQMFSQLNLLKSFDINPNDITESITELMIQEFKSKFDKKFFPASTKKIIQSADCIVISPSDLTSLSFMLYNKEFQDTIKDSEALLIVISPLSSRKQLNPREIPLLKLLGFDCTLDSFFDQIKALVDTVVIDIADTEMAKSAQEKGLQVIIEDLIQIKDSLSFINAILKEVGLSVLDISINSHLT